VIKGTKTVNGKSIMGLMTLGAAKGDEITLEINGDRAEEAMEELGKLLESVHE
jgi:phosphocarrier protein HPr